MEMRAEKSKENNRKQDAERAKKRGDREAVRGSKPCLERRDGGSRRYTGRRSAHWAWSRTVRTEKNGSGRLGKSVRRRRFFLSESELKKRPDAATVYELGARCHPLADERL